VGSEVSELNRDGKKGEKKKVLKEELKCGTGKGERGGEDRTGTQDEGKRNGEPGEGLRNETVGRNGGKKLSRMLQGRRKKGGAEEANMEKRAGRGE